MKNILRSLVMAALGGAVVITSAFIMTGCGNSAKKQAAIDKYGSDTIKLFLPGSYKSKTLIPDFEKEFGVRVIVEEFASNELMYTKVQSGDKYDVLIPSDYMIERLLKQNMLQPLDKAMIPNISLLSDAVKNLSFDPDNTYSIPYFWGNVGIVYNKQKVDIEDLKKEGFSIFHNTKYAGRVYFYDSERDAFMVALKALGYSMNTDKKEEIEKAYEWLNQMMETMKPIFVIDQVIDNMTNGMKDIAIAYSGDAATIINENPDQVMDFFVPAEGTNVWYDAMVIPSNAENPKLANEFINYVISHDAAAGNTEAVGYTTVNAEVYKEMTAPGATYENNSAYKPRVGYEKDEIFHDNEVIRKTTTELMMKVKAHKAK